MESIFTLILVKNLFKKRMKLVNSYKTMNYENYVSGMNGMQEEISSLSELLFEKDQHILDLEAKIEKLEEYKESTEGLKLSGKALLDENKASEQAVIKLKSKEEEYCKSIEELKRLKEESKQIPLSGQDHEPFPINCFFLPEKYTNYAMEIKKMHEELALNRKSLELCKNIIYKKDYKIKKLKHMKKMVKLFIENQEGRSMTMNNNEKSNKISTYQN